MRNGEASGFRELLAADRRSADLYDGLAEAAHGERREILNQLAAVVGVPTPQTGPPPEHRHSSCGGGFVGDTHSEVFDVVDGLIEKHRDVVVIQRVDHAAAAADSSHQTHRP